MNTTADGLAAKPGALSSSAVCGDEGVVVVVDVIRAFTTAAILLSRGVRDIVCVRNVREAAEVATYSRTVRRLVVGERRDPPFPRVDMPNSPVAATTANVAGRGAVFFTVNGTKALAAVPPGRTLLAASLVNAEATANWIATYCRGRPVRIIASEDGAAEDVACAEYLAALLQGRVPDANAARRGVFAGAQQHWMRWGNRVSTAYWQAFLRDVRVCAEVDSYPVPLVCELGIGGWLTLGAEAECAKWLPGKP